MITLSLVCSFMALTFQITALMEEQNDIIKNLSQVEYLSSSTQRAAKIVIANAKDNKIIFYIREETIKLLDSNNPDSFSLLSDEAIKRKADIIIEELNALLVLFELPEDDPYATYNVTSILLASDNHFNNMTNLSLLIMEKSDILAEEIEELQFVSYIILISLGLITGYFFVMSAVDLQTSKRLSKLATIDLATGLNNRSVCQEILKDTESMSATNQTAIVVIDLNDLKATNDLYGHQVGDELISTFANILTEAAEIHGELPFLGRYGGDEFIIYYNDIESKEVVEQFIEKLSSITEEFNEQEDKKFAISYALGHAISNDGLSAKKLFEKADEAMYENKKLMKRRKEDRA